MSYTPTNWVDGQTPVNAENLNKLEQGVADIHTAKENGELDGTPGKSAYQYALDGGYTGTEEEFARKLASESSFIHIGSEPPKDENVIVWVDTDEEPAESGGAQADWNANEGDPGHVLNRTHYSTYENITLLDNQLVESDELIDFKLVEGQTYHVVFDGAEFDNVAKSIDFNGVSLVVIGNDVFLGGDDTGGPYACAYIDGAGTQIMFDAESVTLSISTVQEVVHKLPEKYLPETTPFVIKVYTTSWADYTVLATVANVEEAFAAGRLLFVDIVVGSDEITMNFRLNLIQYCNYVDLSPYGTTFYFSNGDTLAYQFTPQEDGGYAIKRTITEAV